MHLLQNGKYFQLIMVTSFFQEYNENFKMANKMVGRVTRQLAFVLARKCLHTVSAEI